MTTSTHSWTTASADVLALSDGALDPTPGLVLVYSRLRERVPSALPFADDVTTVGRGLDNAVALPEAAVSRYHARVERRGDEVWIVDAGSTNGTLVNGQRVTSCALRDHDIVRIGDSVFRFASQGIYAYSTFPIHGGPASAASRVLVGGYQIQSLLRRLDKVAATDLAVVVSGESGTGKELVAQELHRASGRSGPFRAINCAALPAHLIESELFGYRRGAFTGATTDKPGLIKAAHGGTLFLDEIGDMPLEAQAKLLRVLQEREVLPLGATIPEKVDVRVVCATHRDLDAAVAGGKFRGDLLARLRGFVVDLPPLRQRREDVCPLLHHFLANAGASQSDFTFPYMLALSHYEWPYNVRELETAVRLSLALADGNDLDIVHLPEPVRRSVDHHGEPDRRGTPLPEPLPSRPAAASSQTMPTEDELRALLAQHQGNIAAVGRAFGKERMQVHRWLKRYNIDVAEYRR